MRHVHSLEEVSEARSFLTIGSYDGLHLGHQLILKEMVKQAHRAGCTAVALTFFPNPGTVLRGMSGRFYLTDPDEKAALMSELGVDLLVTIPFTRELASQSAADFVSKLKQSLGLEQMWVGFNFTLGRNREGDIPTLTRLGEVFGYRLKVTEPLQIEGEIVSSSLIRGLLSSGEVEKAARMLGRPYSIPGEVVPGDGRGRTIGIPTANLDTWPERIIPASGVYATWAWPGAIRFPSVTNIGVRPTFTPGETTQHVEAHLLDYHQDLYGRNLRLEFAARLRGEQRFTSVDALRQQIQADIQQARGILQL